MNAPRYYFTPLAIVANWQLQNPNYEALTIMNETPLTDEELAAIRADVNSEDRTNETELAVERRRMLVTIERLQALNRKKEQELIDRYTTIERLQAERRR